MQKRLFAGLIAGLVLSAAATLPAQAACRDKGTCGMSRTAGAKATKSSLHKKTARSVTIHRKTTTKHKALHVPKHRAAPARRAHPASAKAATASQSSIIAMIGQMAPAQGVPTWFALRIARVESNYNPRLRGAAGEYGIFQMKCQTARGIGYTGGCAGLLDARTNVQWGLKHLSLAINASNGNLRLAASKHNGGLGRRTQIASYVAKVF